MAEDCHGAECGGGDEMTLAGLLRCLRVAYMGPVSKHIVY